MAGSMQASRPAAGWSDLPFFDPDEGPDLARAWGQDLGDGSRLVVAADKSVVERVDRRLATIVLIAFAAVLILSLAGSFILGAYLRRRLSAISDAADRIMAGDMAQRVPASGSGDEFDALAHALNRMLDRIAMLLDNLRQVSSDVAHDLRTPLARLRTHLEEGLLEEGEAQRARLESALVQTDRVLSLFASILRITEIEGGRRWSGFADIDLSLLASDIAESYLPVVEEAGRVLTARIAPGVTICGDTELVAQALINLLDNAQLHTPVGTRIELVLEEADGMAVLSVRDDGPGVPKDAQASIFRRFVRLDPARGVQGHGLGLNLVAAIIAAHGGTVDVDDNAPGLRIGFRLPVTLGDGDADVTR